MPLEDLSLVPSVYRPQAARLVTARCDDLISLRVEGDLGDLVLMTLKQRDASASKHVIDSRDTIC